jgi:hypothetical protein
MKSNKNSVMFLTIVFRIIKFLKQENDTNNHENTGEMHKFAIHGQMGYVHIDNVAHLSHSFL